MIAKRRIAKKITKERLDEYLALIGCKTRHCGAGVWRIVNAYGETSVFRFTWREENKGKPLYDITMDGFGENKPFGLSNPDFASAGHGSFLLKNCTLEAYSEDGIKYDFVSISTGKENKPKIGFAYIAFSSKFESKFAAQEPLPEEPK